MRCMFGVGEAVLIGQVLCFVGSNQTAEYHFLINSVPPLTGWERPLGVRPDSGERGGGA